MNLLPLGIKCFDCSCPRNKTLTPNSFSLSLPVGSAVNSKDKHVIVLWNSITFTISQGFLVFLLATQTRSAGRRVEHNRGSRDWLGRHCSHYCESFSFNHVGKILWACGMIHKGRILLAVEELFICYKHSADFNGEVPISVSTALDLRTHICVNKQLESFFGLQKVATK